MNHAIFITTPAWRGRWQYYLKRTPQSGILNQLLPALTTRKKVRQKLTESLAVTSLVVKPNTFSNIPTLTPFITCEKTYPKATR